MPDYSQIRYTRDDDGSDNCREVIDFIGNDTWKCRDCHGTGEYEGEYGPRGCMHCCSRLIPFVNADGKKDDVDWDDVLTRTPQGLVVTRGKNWE